MQRRSRKALADHLASLAAAIIENHTGQPAYPATLRQDRNNGVDYQSGGYAWGVRTRNWFDSTGKPVIKYGDVTIRSGTEEGKHQTEAQRHDAGRSPDLYLYAICDEQQTTLPHWWIINMDALPNPLTTIVTSVKHNTDGSAFYGIPRSTLWELNAIIASHQPTATQLPLL
jgi:hypothetical protein